MAWPVLRRTRGRSSCMTLPRLLVLAALATALAVAAQAPAVELTDGTTLGPDTWEAAQRLLPDEILEHYRTGEYLNRIMEIDRPGYLSIKQPAAFQEATKANRDKYALSPQGSIIDKATGAQPAYITGFPFPDIDPQEPQAATKIVWNYFYSVWWNGNEHFLTELVLLSRRGIDRRLTTDVRMLMYDSAPEARLLPNPNNLVLQSLATVVQPADLNGTVSLTWRFRDPTKHDSQWTYVPGMRRPRQVSALNRSDGFMGSEISLDDGPFFDSKPEDFTFRLLERRDQLVIMDPYSIRGEGEIAAVPGGGWRIVWKDVPRIGADDPTWRGLPWAPVSAVLVRRPMWFVEAVPRDPHYLYGRIVLRFDTETYQGSWVSKYDRAGQLLLSYQASTGAFYSGDGGKTYIPAGGTTVRTAENFLYNRATVVLFPPRNPEHPADYRVPLTHDLFDMDTLVKHGK